MSDGSSSDISEWSAPVAVPGTAHYYVDGTISADIAVSSTSPSTATLTCYSNLGTQPQAFIDARHAQIDAIQTSSNS